ncbi:protein RETICULATA, chloroplastic-like [Wolffia australiana]
MAFAATPSAQIRRFEALGEASRRPLKRISAERKTFSTNNIFRSRRENVARCSLESSLGDVSLPGNSEKSKLGNDLDGSDAINECIGGSGGNGASPPGGGGHGGEGSGPENEDGEQPESLLKFEEVMKEAEARGVKLPADIAEAAKTVGIEKSLLFNYLNLQELAWPIGAAIRWFPWLRDRMLVDRQFLFKVGTEIVIDTCCATVAEVQKRGKDFWAEFELYAADSLVGIVVNVALVGLLAPYARIGRPSSSSGFFPSVARYYDALPSSVFEAERSGYPFSIQQRLGAYFIKGVLYASVGFFCGLVGQGIANMIMTAKRSVKKTEHDVPIPPLIKTAALWGIFLGVSSNTRYQIVNGLERLVESTPAAKRAPSLAMGFTVGIRLANNFYGGLQFVDWARWSGCQ